VKKYFLEIYFPLSIVVAPIMFMLTGIKLLWAVCISIFGIMFIHLYLNKSARQISQQYLKNIFSATKKDF
jgi:hypothetical protein